MTDMQKLKALFDEFGIGYEVFEGDEGSCISLTVGDAKIDGYCGFSSGFNFDETGAFKIAMLCE